MSTSRDTSDQIKSQHKLHLPEIYLPEKLAIHFMASRLDVLQVQ